MGIKTGAKDRLRIAGLFLYLTAKYGIIVLNVIAVYFDIYLRHGCTIKCFFVLYPVGIWAILGIIEWVLYGKIVWKYEIKSKEDGKNA